MGFWTDHPPSAPRPSAQKHTHTAIVQRDKSLDNVDHQPADTPNTERSPSDLDLTGRLNM